MGQLIEGLLSFSRLGRQNLTLRPVELRRVLDEVLIGVEDLLGNEPLSAESRAELEGRLRRGPTTTTDGFRSRICSK